jgi:L-asparagine oxygenase
MEPFYVLSDAEREELRHVLRTVDAKPYEEYSAFSQAVADLIERDRVPAFFTKVCDGIRRERQSGVSDAHVLRNCPIDDEVPYLGLVDPLAEKYAQKKTFVGEAFLELFGRLVATPLLAYETRFNGDFFTDVVAIERYSGMLTAFSEGELAFHNDRTAHSVRADFITLLGMRCLDDDVTYTSFIDGRDLLERLSEEEQAILRQPYFVTPFDVFSRHNNARLTASDEHPILENHHSFRYMDTATTVAPQSPPEAKDALITLKNAIVRVPKKRHRILTGDLFTFANQDGLHSRDKVEVGDPERSRTRWLMKTYAFRDQQAANRHADRWVGGVRGRVGD